MLQLALAAVIGAVVSAGATYSLLREPAPSLPPEELIDSDYALELCRSAAYGQIPGERPTLLAAYEITAGEYAAWALDVRPGEPSAVNNFVREKLERSPTTPLTVCYFETGEPFTIDVPTPHRARVLVDQYGGAFTDTMGSTSLKVTRPGDGPFHADPP